MLAGSQAAMAVMRFVSNATAAVERSAMDRVRRIENPVARRTAAADMGIGASPTSSYSG